MRKFLIAAAVTAFGAAMVPTAPASAQGWYGPGYGYNNRAVQREIRECRRELRRAQSRREYRRELRECRREIAQARRYGYGYYGYRGDRWRDGYRYRDRRWDGRRYRDRY